MVRRREVEKGIFESKEGKIQIFWVHFDREERSYLGQQEKLWAKQWKRAKRSEWVSVLRSKGDREWDFGWAEEVEKNSREELE